MYKHWSFSPTDNTYTGDGAREVFKALPPGFYKFTIDRFGQPQAQGLPLRKDKLCHFMHGPLDNVLKEVHAFWDNNDAYARLGLTHKRGILLHGPAGCGKSAIINSIIEDVVGRKGVAVQVNDIYEDNFRSVIPMFRQIQPESQIVAILEDIEQHVLAGDEEELLDLLDGASSTGDGVLFVCTTNNLKKIPFRIRCRPSRIDTLIEIGLPTEEQRREYVKFLAGELLKKDQLAEMVSLTNDLHFSLADMKELVISVVVFKKTIEQSVQRLKDAKAEEEKEEE